MFQELGISDEDVTAFEITADGDWVLEIGTIDSIPTVSCPYGSEADAVVVVEQLREEGGMATLRTYGDSNFFLFGGTPAEIQRGSYVSLMFDTRGSREVEVNVPPDRYLWVVDTDAAWTVEC